MAKAAPASSQMPAAPPISTRHGTMPGVARNMPMMPQMAPQSASDNSMKTGLTFSPVPMILGSMMLPPVN